MKSYRCKTNFLLILNRDAPVSTTVLNDYPVQTILVDRTAGLEVCSNVLKNPDVRKWMAECILPSIPFVHIMGDKIRFRITRLKRRIRRALKKLNIPSPS